MLVSNYPVIMYLFHVSLLEEISGGYVHPCDCDEVARPIAPEIFAYPIGWFSLPKRLCSMNIGNNTNAFT